MPNLPTDIVELLEAEAAAINRPEFIEDDPVKFPRLFNDLRDIEIVSLLVSSIAWGNRRSILADSSKMLSLMDYQPYKFMMEKGYEDLPTGDNRVNIHRTFFTDNLRRFLSGLHKVYEKHESLNDFVTKNGISSDPFPAWRLAESLNKIFCDANNGVGDSRCLPLDTSKTALKRLNMALRWLVRDDGIVDLGVWDSLRPSQLFIPLDVHVAGVSRDLGLLSRRSNDRQSVVELTDTLRQIRPHDPVLFDFALFGIGVTGRRKDLAV